ncbi:hypothetical protein BVI434_180070 [Burkholderia vietnamiensis]|nr:hypothetical protein BVI434_180070 [Burkholderia vietnamiensis]
MTQKSLRPHLANESQASGKIQTLVEYAGECNAELMTRMSPRFPLQSRRIQLNPISPTGFF